MAIGEQDGRGVPVTQRLPFAASISLSISRSVRYSRGRADLTVTFTALEAHGSTCVFSMTFANPCWTTVTIHIRSVTVCVHPNGPNRGIDIAPTLILRSPHEPPTESALCAASGGGPFLQAWGLRAGLAKSPELSFMDAGGARRLRKASGIYLKPRSGAFLLGGCQGFP